MRVGASAWRSFSVLVCLGVLSGCKTWQTSTLSPERLIAEERPSSIRVTTSDGVAVTLKHPGVINDSIVSRTAGTGLPFAASRMGVASRDVRSVEVPRLSRGRTIALAATIAAVSIGWATVANDSRGGSTIITEPLPKTPALSLGSLVRLALGVLGR